MLMLLAPTVVVCRQRLPNADGLNTTPCKKRKLLSKDACPSFVELAGLTEVPREGRRLRVNHMGRNARRTQNANRRRRRKRGKRRLVATQETDSCGTEVPREGRRLRVNHMGRNARRTQNANRRRRRKRGKRRLVATQEADSCGF